jgi:hypothetical protein
VDHNSPTSQKLAAVFLFGLALITYLPSLGNGFIWDDDAYVQHNPTLRSASGLWQIWTEPTSTPQYYPLVYTTFWVEHHLWGDRPLGYHVDNMLLHAIGAVLLWRLLKRLKIPMPWLAAAIFAVHPINVESVAWITERKNVLSGVFYFLAFGAYLGAIESTTLNRRRYAVALVFFLLALFSKTVTATFLAAVLLVLWWRRGKITRKEIVPLLPFFIVGIALGSVTGYLERTHIGAHGVEWSSLTPLDRLLIATRAVWFYAGKLALPIKLTFIYPRWLIDPQDAGRAGCDTDRAMATARPNRSWTADRRPLFHRHALSRAWFRQRLSDALLLRRRSFPISGRHWIDLAVHCACRVDAINWIADDDCQPGRGSSGCIELPSRVHLQRRRNPLARHDRQKSQLMDGPRKPRPCSSRPRPGRARLAGGSIGVGTGPKSRRTSFHGGNR